MKLFEKKLTRDEYWRNSRDDSEELEKLKNRFNSVCELLGIGFISDGMFEKAMKVEKDKK
jgi:hypothetical protein